MVLVAHAKHPVHRVKGPLDRAALAAFVEVQVADSGLREAPPPTRLASIGSPHLFELSDFASKREAIREGLGFGWLPLHLVDGDLASGELVTVPFVEGDRYTLQPLVAHRQGRPLGPAARALFDDLVAAASAPAKKRKK